MSASRPSAYGQGTALLTVPRSAEGPAGMAPGTVLHLIETGGPGGAERMLVHLAGGLSPAYRSHAGLLREGWLSRALRQQGVPVTLLRYGKGASARLSSLATLHDLVRHVREHQVSLLHTHEFFMNMLGLAVSKLTGIPQVATVHGKNYYAERWRRRVTYRLVARGAGRLVAVSEDIRRFLIERVGVAPDRVAVVPNGVSVPAAPPRDRLLALRRSLAVEDDAVLIIAVGSLYPVKGHTYLLDAARLVLRRCPQARFVIAGGGGLRQTLEGRARELGLDARARFLGHRDDVSDLLAASDVFVLPSLSEGTPLALLEAMAAGLPAVASAVGGVGAVLEHGATGLLVPPADGPALAEAIVRLLGDRDEARAMGRAARGAVADRFSLRAMIEAYEALYRALRTGASERRHAA